MSNEEVGNRIRQAREDLGLTQADVADDLKLTRTAIGRIERGLNSLTLANLFELPRILHQPIEYFLGLESDLTPEEAEILEIYRSLSAIEQHYCVEMLRMWLRERPAGLGELEASDEH